MAKRRIFTVETPLGYRVTLTRDRWRQITRTKHPAIKGHEKKVRESLASPQLVRESAKDPDVHLYYSSADDHYVCVVVAPENGGDRFVVTAYFTTNIKKGSELWKS